MKITQTALPRVTEVETTPFTDHRGAFACLNDEPDPSPVIGVRHIEPTNHSHTATVGIGCTGSACLDTILQLRPPFGWHKPDGGPRRRLLDVNRIGNLGWQAQTSLREGIQVTHADYLNGSEGDICR